MEFDFFCNGGGFFIDFRNNLMEIFILCQAGRNHNTIRKSKMFSFFHNKASQKANTVLRDSIIKYRDSRDT